MGILITLGTVFAVFMHVIACFMFCCGIQMVFRDVAVDRKQLCRGRLVTVVDWLDECEGDGLLDCGCTRKHWTDPWMGFGSKTHWTDLHGMRLLMDCTLDETWHETPVSLEYCESPLKGKDCCLRCQAVMFACVCMLLTECVQWIALQTS